MRLLIFLIGIVSISTSVNGQVAFNTENSDSSNVYFQSLEILCNAYAQNGYKEILVEESNTTKGLPNKCQGITIEYIDRVQIKKLTKKGNDLLLHRIIPLRLQDGIFFVNILEFNVSRIKKKYNYVNQGGHKLNFVYDCAKRGLVYAP